MNVIVYFHGLGSSSKTDKVDRLKNLYPDSRVVAFDASVDPDIAKETVGNSIFADLGIDETPGNVTFIGTSLGAWLANEMSNKFNIPAILINPSYNPSKSLARLDVSKSLLDRYTPMNFDSDVAKVIIVDPVDEVIDHSELLCVVPNSIPVHKYFNSGHRFNGVEFESAISDAMREIHGTV